MTCSSSTCSIDAMRPIGSRRTHNHDPGVKSADSVLKDPGARNSIGRQHPAYRGVWEAKKIANPVFEVDNLVYQYDDFGFIGFDFWQVNGGMIFNE